ncbi:uncharacterized protein SAPINGB_P002825 [Magnusiomyces paraingens]|uniref:Kynurenine 3-monooxygenase n=1 Tax=Magnusiomyces paraingens TaxID=2606893 RepID=A0A5E8BIA9_9ASCO|nr:uncharacterized protein SAPINGB_P002825 [Saprochaete ingens]VVT50622.1 unnamed protein product [Saprochaete ingens]
MSASGSSHFGDDIVMVDSIHYNGSEPQTPSAGSFHSSSFSSEDQKKQVISDDKPAIVKDEQSVPSPAPLKLYSPTSSDKELPPREIKTIAVIGAGLVGCVAALAFQKKGYKVKVFEGRPDARTPEQREIFSYRSINMAVSARGILTLDSIDQDMSDRVLQNLIPMHGRMIHDLAGDEISQKYGLYGEAINSIDRADLNRSLLDELDSSNIETYFNHKLVHASFEPKTKLTFTVDSEKPNDSKETAVFNDIDLVIGADGAHSKVRAQLGKYVRLNFSQEYIDSAYVELRIEPNKPKEDDDPVTFYNGDQKFKLDKNHLHIWPRHEYMLIALPNTDGSFTSTLFAPWSLLESLDSEEKWFDFFWTNFPDIFEKSLMTKESLIKAYHENPRGSLVCVRCSPYNYKDKAIILGDAAHSMVPFYGQGMNCGFEDVRVLMSLLDKHHFSFKKAFDEYSATRNKDLNAIVDLAMRNYIEMRHSVISMSYLLRKKLDNFLSKTFGNHWLPLYTMVTFRPDISYSEALRRETLQAKIVHNIVYYSTGILALTGVVTAIRIIRKLKIFS